jgi:DNA-directed RNA polymerase subunit H (RpoH/RPB5)
MSQSFDRLFAIKKESLKLLETQGYNIDNERVLFEYSLEDFKDYIKSLPSYDDNEIIEFLKDQGLNTPRSYLSNIYVSRASEDVKVVVYFAISNKKKVAEADIQSFCRMIERFGVTNAIMISEVPLSSQAESLCTEFVPCRVGKGGKKYGCFIQHFEDNELFFDPLDHIFVPKHRLLSRSEVEDLVKNDKIQIKQLPQISALEPIAKRLGARPGMGTRENDDDVIEITRKILVSDVLLKEEIVYRGVYMPQREKKDRSSKK